MIHQSSAKAAQVASVIEAAYQTKPCQRPAEKKKKKKRKRETHRAAQANRP
jgi:hypothetical protein